jgi:hypothetical protein
MPANPQKDFASRAKFIFRGSVQKLGASNVTAAPANAKTIVVRIEEIIAAPAVLSQFVGRDITVQFEVRPKLKAGQRAIFYTNGWLFGESIAVQALAAEPVEERAAVASSASSDPVQNLKVQNLQARIASADVVVAGKVSSVRLPPEENAQAPSGAVALAGRRAARGEAPQRRRGPITEHDPKWREAVIEVAKTEKGSPGKKEVVVRFPSSNDVRWYKAPKFVPGQEGVFILHKTQKPARPAAARRLRATVTAAEAETTEAFTALDPVDFQPLAQKPEIRSLINADLQSLTHEAKRVPSPAR